MPPIERKGRLDGRQRNRLKGLLNMMYRPSELADEIGFSRNQIYMTYVPLGCPHERDENDHIWINGELFRDWYINLYQKPTIGEDQAFCLTCKQAVEMVDPVRHEKQGLVYYVCTCPKCNRRLSRIITLNRPA